MRLGRPVYIKGQNYMKNAQKIVLEKLGRRLAAMKYVDESNN